MLRSTLLWLSRNKTVRTTTTRWGFARRAARRFVAGETVDDAIAAIRDLNAHGITATLDHLGENVETLDDARRATDDYVQVLDAIGASGVQSHVSVKLTALGLDLGDDVCRANVARIVAKAKDVGTRVRIDMESTEYTDRTLAIYRDLAREYDNVGIVIQAYLYRSEADIAALCQTGAHVRLCKGAYKEPPVHALPKKADVEELRLGDYVCLKYPRDNLFPDCMGLMWLCFPTTAVGKITEIHKEFGDPTDVTVSFYLTTAMENGPRLDIETQAVNLVKFRHSLKNDS